MPAITVRSARINRPLGEVTNLRVSVDRSLASAGGPGAAGVVVNVPVTAQGLSIVLPAITLYSTYNAADIVTRGAQYRAELVDGAGAVVQVLAPGFDAFLVQIPNTCTTWDELNEHNDFLKQTQFLVQDQVPSMLMADVSPFLIDSSWTVIGTRTISDRDNIGLYFGNEDNPPGFRFSVCAGLMQYSDDGITWQGFGGGGGGFTPTSCNIGAVVTPGFPARLVGLDANGCLVSFLPADSVPFWFATPDSGGTITVDFGDNLPIIGDPGIKTRNLGGLRIGPDFDNLPVGTGAPSTIQLVTTTTAQPDGARITITQVRSGDVGNALVIGADGGLFVAAGSFSFNLAGDSGTPQPITNGNTLLVAGANGIVTNAGSTDTLTIDVDILNTGGMQFTVGQLGIKLDTITGGGNNIAQLSSNGLYVPPGAGGSFIAAGDSGPSQTISSGDTLTLAGGSGINSVASATDTVTFNLDLAPTQAGVPNALSIIATQVYGKPREFKTVLAVAANYTIVPATDNVIIVDTSGGSRTITLATPGATDPRDFHIKKRTTDSNNVVLTPASGQIDNGASYSFNGVIGTAGESRHVVWDGTNWWVL